MQSNFKCTISVSCHPVSGNKAYRYFSWVLPTTTDAEEQRKKDTEMLCVLVQEYLPKRLQKEEDAALRDAYRNPAVKVPKAVMTCLLNRVGLISNDPHRNSARDRHKQTHVEHFIQQSEHAFVTNLLAAGHNPTDMRCLNGRYEDSGFADVIDCVHKLLSERDQIAPDERRHAAPSSLNDNRVGAGAVRVTPLAPSMRALLDEVTKMMHDSPEMKARLDAG